MHERTKKYEEISGFINEVISPRVIVPFFPAGSFYSAGVDWIWAGWSRPISDAAGVVIRTHTFEAQLIGNWATSMAKQLSDDWWVDDIHQIQEPLCCVVSVLLVAAGILLI